ncbi:MAG: YdiU family protein [Leptolyngbya sp. UWPOB_LEPTO1]|uniref:protein adenylyltransferase SelO n=1 Tax=Leptolyngbya sp. UWPOB_LEPTO1 TaxID=2815653 RepID=UPI001AC5031C|nr:YdiU family protein [Leptolyngbya sp. UWPOB_LEPTO1]MBN8562315.1 YdiU family protein [Leptolyngbya sp. UWPOB_LEPTO1]
MTEFVNPLLALDYEPAFERLGDDFSDRVSAASFPQHILRFRNDDILAQLGLDAVTDEHFIEAFGKFQGRDPLLAMRYHGYQFGTYNPALGDGRGFLYGQVRANDGELYDFGTKGSGTTPYSRGGDGRLTLKGGVREVLAAEMLHRLKVRTSRCLSLIETGEGLWRGDEPSPTRSSVMIRFSRSHIRFGTFERLDALNRKDLIAILLDHVIEIYYPHLINERDRYALFYAELVEKVADLVAQWMAAGFCHAVLNTDNMSITGESFDYGPYAFIPAYQPGFTAAYFDYYGRYAYANQPEICYWNLEMLQAPLKRVISAEDLKSGLSKFVDRYESSYRQRMLYRLGFDQLEQSIAANLVYRTVQFLQASQIDYHDFFAQITQQFDRSWSEDAGNIFSQRETSNTELATLFENWRQSYCQALNTLSHPELEAVPARLKAYNPDFGLVRSEIEAVWNPIADDDNWQPFYDLLTRIRH